MKWHLGTWVTGVCALSLGALLPPARADSSHAPPLPPVKAQVLTRLPVHSRLLALTFDACQTHKMAGYDARIVHILKQTRTPATLMLGGRWMDTHPQATRALAANPLFEMGSHSYWHPHMARLSAAQMELELQSTQDAQWRLTGRQGTLFRPPYGEYNPLLVQTAARMGLTTFTWDVVTGDPDPHISASDIVRTVRTRVRPGSIVIMHINGRGWHTAEALPTLIDALRHRGWRFVTVSQMRSAAFSGQLSGQTGGKSAARDVYRHLRRAGRASPSSGEGRFLTGHCYVR